MQSIKQKFFKLFIYYILLCKMILIYDCVDIQNELLQPLFRYGRFVLCTVVVLEGRRYTMIVTGAIIADEKLAYSWGRRRVVQQHS